MNFTYKKISILLVFFLSSVLPLGAFDSTSISREQGSPLSGSKSDSSARITLEVKGMDVVDVLKILADRGKLNLSISGNVKGRITLFFKDVDVWDALEMVAVAGNLAYDKRGDIIYVMTDREYEMRYGKRYWDKKETRIFTLRYAKVAKISTLLSQVASKIGKVIADESTNTIVAIDIPEKIDEMVEIVQEMDKPIETKVFALNYLPVEELEKKVTEMLSKDVGIIRVDPYTNKVIVADYPAKIREISDMIEAFDEKPLQVLINAKIIEIQPSEAFYSGINWDYWIEKYFSVQGGFVIPAGDVTDKISFGTIDQQKLYNRNESDRKGDPERAGQYRAILDFLKTFGKTRILSSPRILTLNNQEAKIIVGTKDAYITSSVAAIGDDAVTTQEVNFVEVGVKLFVTPTINKAGYITMKIRPEVSSADTVKLTSEDKITEVPIVTTSEAETTVIVKEGVSIIMGGLRKFNATRKRNQVPVLGSIPFLGVLFRSDQDEWQKNELVIVLTPQIISGDKAIEAELMEKMQGEMGETEAMDEFRRAEEIADEKKGEDEICRLDKTGKKICQERVIDVENLVEQEMKEDEPTKKSTLKGQKKTKEEIRGIQKQRYKYYLKIVDKIKQTAAFFEGRIEGKIRLKFVVSRQGRLVGEPIVVASDTNEYLSTTAKEIIKNSSPFPPFPSFSLRDQETFEVLLVF